MRACLKQPELSPISVPAQIAVLLALTAQLFDRVALDRMVEAVARRAERRRRAFRRRFAHALESAHKLSDEDRKAIIEIARRALAAFEPKPAAAAAAKPSTEEKP